MIYNPSEESLRICAVLQHRGELFFHASEDSIYTGATEVGFRERFRLDSKNTERPYIDFESYLENEEVNVVEGYAYNETTQQVVFDMSDLYTVLTRKEYLSNNNSLGQADSVIELHYQTEGVKSTQTFYIYENN